jgi:hypothetical protein
MDENGNWVGRFYDAANGAFPAGEIGKVLKPTVERLGVEVVERGWKYWCKHAVTMGEPPRSLNPKGFLRKLWYWTHLSTPVDL